MANRRRCETALTRGDGAFLCLSFDPQAALTSACNLIQRRESIDHARPFSGIRSRLCAQQALADTRLCFRQHLYLYPQRSGYPVPDPGSVKAGEPLEVKAVNQEAGFTQVVDGRGREGWIKNSELQGRSACVNAFPGSERAGRSQGPSAEPNGDNEKRFAEKDGKIAEQSKEIASLKARLDSQSAEMSSPGTERRPDPEL